MPVRSACLIREQKSLVSGMKGAFHPPGFLLLRKLDGKSTDALLVLLMHVYTLEKYDYYLGTL